MTEKSANAALATLIILQGVMLAALYAGVAPHPPAKIILFGIAPFLAASLSAAASAMIIGPLSGVVGKLLTFSAAAMALLSFGPQKYFDPQFPLIWPAVIVAQLASLVLIGGMFRVKERVEPQS